MTEPSEAYLYTFWGQFLVSSECPIYSKSCSLFYSGQASLSPLSVLGMIHKALWVLGIVWVMIFQQLFCPGICLLPEFMEFQSVDTQIFTQRLKRCFTDVQSFPSVYFSFPKPFPEISRWVCLSELFCVSSTQQDCWALSFIPSQLCSLEIVSGQRSGRS